MAQLRLVKPAAAPPVVTHTNRMGDTYYLHEGKTKTGRPRYFFAKSVYDGPLAAMPPGFEVSESINGVVSVRRSTEGAGGSALVVPDADVKLVEAAVGRHAHLRGYMVRVVRSAIVVFEPHPKPAELRELAERLGRVYRAESFIEDRMKRAQYAPVLKFEREDDGYVVHRMTYRGKGGWSWAVMNGKIAELVKRVVSSIGTDDFFELI